MSFLVILQLNSKILKMSLLSITFHTIEQQFNAWEQYTEEHLYPIIETFSGVQKYILSDVVTEMLSEGKNTNLLLEFKDKNQRDRFLESELPNLHDHITEKFGDTVMIFITQLNIKKSRG